MGRSRCVISTQKMRRRLNLPCPHKAPPLMFLSFLSQAPGGVGTAPSPPGVRSAATSTPLRGDHGTHLSRELRRRCLVIGPRRREGGAGGDPGGQSMPRERPRPLPLQPGAPAAARRAGPRACPGAPSGAAPRRPSPSHHVTWRRSVVPPSGDAPLPPVHAPGPRPRARQA